VRPHLANKSPRQFIDEWLLEQNLETYLAPWRYQQLNTVERVLLAKHFEDKRAGLIRLFENNVSLQPIPIETQTQWFGQALRTSELALDALDATNGYFFDKRLMESEEFGLRPGAPATGGRLAGGIPGGMGGGGMGGMGPGDPGSGGEVGSRGLASSITDAVEFSKQEKLSLARKESRGRGALRDMAAEDKAGKSDELSFGVQAGKDISANDFVEELAAGEADAKKMESLGRYLKRSDENSIDRFGRRKLAELGQQIQLFEPLAPTRKWAESQFDQVLLGNQNASLVTPNPFWVDTLKLPPGALSENLHFAARSSNEALLALSFMDLPLESKAGELKIENGRWIYQHSGKTLAYVQGIVAIDPNANPQNAANPADANNAAAQSAVDPKSESSKVLLSENLYLANADTTAPAVKRQELVIGVPYRDRVVLTNPTGNPMRVQILMQIPQGAIPLEAGRSVTVRDFQLAPFSTQETSHVFYFPSAGEFQHYGARASSAGKYLAHVQSEPVKVLDAPLNLDDASWEYIAAWGSNDQVLEALDRVNVAKIDLGLIAWRMKDKGFWTAILDKLDRIGMYNPVLWGYSLAHREAKRLKEFLEANDVIVNAVSPVFHCSVMDVDQESRLRIEHLDFRPIVVARSHRLGKEWKILNDGLATQYQSWLQMLAYEPKIAPRQRLSLVYYQLIQNRVEEAVANFKRVDRASLLTGKETTEAQMQYDYFDAYFAMRTGAWDKAKAIATKYASYPVPRWNGWFAQIADQLREREELQNATAGKVASKPEDAETGSDPTYRSDAERELEGGREAALASGAAKLPGLELTSKDGQFWIQHRNIESFDVNVYFVDVELMFSRNPFMGQNQSRSAVIEPNRTQKFPVAKAGAWEKSEWKIPDDLKNRNMILEVVSGGITRSLPVYSNSLNVNLTAPLGRLQVLSAANKHPLEGAYIKVYAKHNDGSVRFYKDGYSDLRGIFDYATLSTEDWSTVSRFAILVIHPELGAWIQEAEPVAR
jgi:hypothetical protein